MGQRMSRQNLSQSFALTTSLATTAKIPYSEYAGGRIHIPTGSSITSLTYYDAPTDDTAAASYSAAYDDAGAITQTVAAAKSYPIPTALFGSAFLRIVANAADTVLISRKG